METNQSDAAAASQAPAPEDDLALGAEGGICFSISNFIEKSNFHEGNFGHQFRKKVWLAQRAWLFFPHCYFS